MTSPSNDTAHPPGAGRASRAQELADELLSAIRDGVVRPGARLPTEAELSREHGVSRTVVREAIARLRAAGIVRSSQGRGTFVLAVPTARPTAPSPAAGMAGLIALLELRTAVEVEAALLAASRHTTRDLARIADAFDAFAGSRDDPSAALRADLDFHLGVARAAHNEQFTALLESWGVEMIAMPGTRLLPDDGHFDRVVAEHSAIAAAIAEDDPAAAAAAMRTHLANSIRRVRAGADAAALDSSP